MKKHFFILFITSILLIQGCYDPFHSSSSGDDGSIIELNGKVLRVNNPGVVEGSLRSFDISGNKRIVYTSSTRATKAREPSCSGLAVASHNDIRIGDILYVKYRNSDVNYDSTVPEYIAISIEAFSPDCLQGRFVLDGSSESDCQLCDFIN